MEAIKELRCVLFRVSAKINKMVVTEQVLRRKCDGKLLGEHCVLIGYAWIALLKTVL